jgi:[ribosomal protein S18]-alanine N-acetyltransferase
LGAKQVEACLALDQASLGGLWTREQWQQELSQSDRLCVGLLIEQRLIAVACGWLVVDELQIGAVAVAPDQRRQGHGRQVLMALLQEARRRGAMRATLEVSAANTAATALYRRCGFSTEGIRRGYYRNGDDALIQWVQLQDMETVRIAAHS